MAMTLIPSDTFKVGFIGAGQMAESIAKGVVNSGILSPSRIRTAHLNPQRREVFQSFGVSVSDQNHQVVEDCDVVIFSVKPQIVKDVVLQLRPKFSEKQLLVSVVAGTKLKDLKEWSGQNRFIRVMPNTPAAVGTAASVISVGGGTATEEDIELIARLFGSIGKVWKAEEKLFDAITGLSGSGPAYIFLAIEALADGGVAAGLPRELAKGLATQTAMLYRFLEQQRWWQTVGSILLNSKMMLHHLEAQQLPAFMNWKKVDFEAP
ncbi:pyrroline-5-carboxylate reductase-like isoform X2 [Amaranthus tricolor]|uniref:pyrroline-5-carboxylate reductase-like isoform X2 n=1 Tax=Amaranthus tricolor TaxID=29722 RepID=UPI002588FD18|nr:pyrroline-5-carboxylate reductase-like isoform X2 [Amaranthus tricolor]